MKHTRKARLLTLGAAVLLWLSATAQVTPPQALDSGRTSDADSILRDPSSLYLLVEPEQPAASEPAVDDVNRQRALHPELGRVLGIAAAIEAELLVLLAQDAATRKAVADGLSGNPVEQEARAYDERMRRISELIGAAQLDTWLEYLRTRKARLRVQSFDASLPAAMRLSDVQKDAFVAALGQDEPEDSMQRLYSALQRRMRSAPTPRSAAELQRDTQRLYIDFDEQEARRLENAYRTLLAKLTPILTTEQLRIYVQGEAEQVASLRRQARQRRIQAGLRPNEPVGVEVPAVTTSNEAVQLDVRVRVNGMEINQTLTSPDGRAVTFEGPQGLLLEVRPRLHVSGQLMVDLNGYESTRDGRRLVGSAETSALITNPRQQPTYPGLGTTNRDWLFRGRRAYVLDWDAKVTYL